MSLNLLYSKRLRVLTPRKILAACLGRDGSTGFFEGEGQLREVPPGGCASWGTSNFYRLQNWKKMSVQGLNFCLTTGTFCKFFFVTLRIWVILLPVNRISSTKSSASRVWGFFSCNIFPCNIFPCYKFFVSNNPDLLLHWKIDSFSTALVHFTKCFSIFVCFLFVLKINCFKKF